MEIAPKHNYVYEKCENGLKGGLCMDGGNPFAHLSVPIGVIVIRETATVIPQHYNEFENTDYNTIDDDMFNVLVDKCSHYIRNNRETRKRTHNRPLNISKKMKKKIII
jgi:hypothetical protein